MIQPEDGVVVGFLLVSDWEGRNGELDEMPSLKLTAKAREKMESQKERIIFSLSRPGP